MHSQYTVDTVFRRRWKYHHRQLESRRNKIRRDAKTEQRVASWPWSRALWSKNGDSVTGDRKSGFVHINEDVGKYQISHENNRDSRSKAGQRVSIDLRSIKKRRLIRRRLKTVVWTRAGKGRRKCFFVNLTFDEIHVVSSIFLWLHIDGDVISNCSGIAILIMSIIYSLTATNLRIQELHDPTWPLRWLRRHYAAGAIPAVR